MSTRVKGYPILFTDDSPRLTVANEMVSLVGSIQPDPFSPQHVRKPNTTTPVIQEAVEPEGDSEEEDDMDATDRVDNDKEKTKK